MRVLLNSTITFHPDSTYDVNIDENSDSGTELLVLNATSSTGAILKFNQINLLSQFRVEESSGSIQLTGALDFETTESYSLRVEATDNGDPPNMSPTSTPDAILQNERNIIAVNMPLLSTPFSTTCTECRYCRRRLY